MRKPTNSERSDQSANADITAKLISTIKGLISKRVLVPGCKLPPERELARRFGVNRSSLRQALKVLQLMGVLYQRVGDGTYLHSNAANILHEPMEFLILMGDISHEELLEAGLIVESELVTRAADRATTEDLAALRHAIADLENSHSEEARLDADVAFHEAIFRASGNRVCQLIFTVIHRAMLMSMAQISRRVDRKRPLAFHKAIYSAIYKRRPEEARRLMAEHLTDSKSLLHAEGAGQVDALALEQITPLPR
jgi:GntR family transcriptional repressor for pyruvate dehydrogenase complex